MLETRSHSTLPIKNHKYRNKCMKETSVTQWGQAKHVSLDSALLECSNLTHMLPLSTTLNLVPYLLPYRQSHMILLPYVFLSPITDSHMFPPPCTLWTNGRPLYQEVSRSMEGCMSRLQWPPVHLPKALLPPPTPIIQNLLICVRFPPRICFHPWINHACKLQGSRPA